MNDHEIALQTFFIAQYSARWARYALWISGFSAAIAFIAGVVTFWAVLVARKGLSSWKDQHISNAKAEWIASLVNFASGVSYLPCRINWENKNDAQHIDRVAELQYECIKCWKVLQVHLAQNPKLEKEFYDRYAHLWGNFSVESHNSYMNGKMDMKELKNICINLYNT
ncbi:Uncharacterised protein [Klebsiella variicola]|uniref:hypothetical protein n=1 Tax=Klebsiella TaxID=570 RepID=UPI000E2D52B6|nr:MULTISPECIES: hypothetical protein [Klebsiella]NIG26578.1 hypothetical protein [Klebsiella sp. Acro-834]NIG40934.1 hypothetical protein [Klebsiella sp. Acro-833]SXE51721.1 Uncharacterised protein [Klebsiella variicola]SXE60630.1 Uncharacterised protein [Klebsiella variicola]HCB9205885.1 hypothetical protein [Klebsiella variicola]